MTSENGKEGDNDFNAILKRYFEEEVPRILALEQQRQQARDQYRRKRHGTPPVVPPRVDYDNHLLVLFRLSSFWGLNEEIERRNALAEAIEERFDKAGGIGLQVGRGCGMGSADVSFGDIWDPDLAEAVRIIKDELHQRQLADRAFLVHTVWVIAGPDDPDAEDGQAPRKAVLWPEGYEGDVPSVFG